MSIPLQFESQSVSGVTHPGVARKAGERLRILHVTSYFGRGGAEMGILKLIRGLGEDEFEQEICTTRGFDEDFATSQISLDKLHSAGTHRQKYQFPLFRLSRVIRRYRPHVVHTRNWGGLEAVLAARFSAVPVVVHSEHGYEVDMFAGLPIRRRLLRRILYPFADAIFAVTRELRNFHAAQAWVMPKTIKVLYNGVDTDRFQASDETRIAIRKEFGFADKSFVVGSVGRLVAIKDHRTLLQAAGILAEKGLDIRVFLVGAGPEMPRLQSMASGILEGRVVFAGDSDRVAELLNAMDAYVLPSLGEGMSNTLLEAMASSLPAIATRVGGNTEIIESDEHGWLFSPGDIAVLAESLSKLAENRSLGWRIGQEARNRVCTAFGLDRMMENYRALYVDLAIRRGVAAGRMEATHVRN
jgi:sugar transferase (PEP-CTERM/EpsH1 system associated)